MVEHIPIPIELLEQLERGNVLLFVGEGINQGVLPSSAELAEELAARCDYPPEEPLTLPRVAGYYEMTRDRHGLIQFLRDRLDDPALAPLRAHRLAVRLRPPVIVTTCYDRLLEQALREAGIPYMPAVGNAEIAYAEERKVLLVWLWGVLDQPDSLVVTEDDRRLFLEGRANLSDVLRAELARRTWLFVGFDVEDEWFRAFYDTVSQRLGQHTRRAYILGTETSTYVRHWWKKRNAEIISSDVDSFLTILTQQTSEHVGCGRLETLSGRPSAVAVREPYTLLASSKTPALVIYLIDLGYSLQRECGGKPAIQVTTDALTASLVRMVFRSTKGSIVSPRYRVGIYGYTRRVIDFLGGVKSIAEVAKEGVPDLQVSSEAGDLFAGFLTVYNVLKSETRNRDQPAPLVCHITGGEYLGRNPEPIASQIRSLHIPDGKVLIGNVLISDETTLWHIDDVYTWPGIRDENELSNAYARQLFRMSSEIPESYLVTAWEMGYSIQRGARLLFPGNFPEIVELGMRMSAATPVR